MVSTIKFSQFQNGGDLSNDNITVGLESSSNVQFNNPWTFLPPGTTGDRPVPAPSNYYRLRFNTTLEVYEYYDAISATWTQLSGSGTGTVNPGVTNDLAFYPANGTALSPVDRAANSVLVTDAGMVPSLSTTLPSGLTIPGATITGSTASLTSGQVAAVPSAATDLTNKSYVDSLFNSGVQSITGTTNQVIASSPTGNVTLSLPQDIATGSSPTFSNLTLSSPLPKASGGTGVTSVTTTPTASEFAGWDVNSNLRANNFIEGFATTATSGGTTTLTVASAGIQEFTGALTQTVVMPVTTTLIAGHQFIIINNSSGNLTINSSGGNLILTMAANTTAFITCVVASGTGAASWNASYMFDQGAGVLSITGTANQIAASSSTGNVTLSLPAVLDFPGTFTVQNTVYIDEILDEDDMASDSATALATQQSIKAYVDNNSAFAAGTKMLFVQTSAPTGWTKDTVNNNNSALRVVTGSASAGGTVDFTTAFASQAVTGTVGNFTLTTAEIPSHSHIQRYGTATAGGGVVTSGSAWMASPINSTISTATSGGGGAHNHSFTGTSINLAVKYVDVIICSKD